LLLTRKDKWSLLPGMLAAEGEKTGCAGNYLKPKGVGIYPQA